MSNWPRLAGCLINKGVLALGGLLKDDSHCQLIVRFIVIVGRMFRIVFTVLLQLLAPYIAIMGDVSVPFAYADTDSDSNRDADNVFDSDSDDGDDSDDSDEPESESETGNHSNGNPGNTGNESKGTDNEDDADDESNNSYEHGIRTNKSSTNLRNNGSGRSHQRSIRNAVQQKQILPLGEIKRHIEKKTKSEIIYIELEQEDGQWVYEFKIIDSRGHLREIYVDANSGKILKSKPIGKQSR